MGSANGLYKYLNDGISFVSQKAMKMRTIYFPLSGIDASSLKSSITPYLSGDIKIDKNRYLTRPTSTEDLRQDLRNVFFDVRNKGRASLAQECSEESSSVEIGQLWHKVTRQYLDVGLEVEALNFVPVTGENVELMKLTVKNVSNEPISVTPTTAIPIFARALANKHDHEHVTSLLNRISIHTHGVIVEPSMIFNEEGHLTNATKYFVLGSEVPTDVFPTVESFYGDRGTFFAPSAVENNLSAAEFADEDLQGKEAMGGLRFKEVELQANESKDYYLLMGIANENDDVQEIYSAFNDKEKFETALEKNRAYWLQKSHSIKTQTADQKFNSWMHWVVLQPVLRRIFGCSFLPDHDYGKGGKGWRDIWQDLLSLILIEPETVRDTLINNFAGVRIDGTNATIIGAAPGEFDADRNAITRVWMDHGVWPLSTLILYIDQTGDYDILLENNSYFRDPQLSRTLGKDHYWAPEYGKKLKDKDGNIYEGSIIEHLLVQLLVQFFNVGEHNITRLENADWNDGLDMAFHRGESVAFMSFYGGNFFALADLLESFAQKQNIDEIEVARELKDLFNNLSDNPIDYDQIEQKKKALFDEYYRHVQPEISGEKVKLSIQDVVQDLREKGQWIFQHVSKNEKVTVDKDGKQHTWFNGYYDNTGARVEGEKGGHVWMTLTGQVFPVMSGLASKEEIEEVIQSVREYLWDKKLGGVRLNSDFGVNHYLDFGRAFGFAYGTKENGSFFSHMNVMYAYALYKQGFAKEGHAVLRSIFDMCMDTEKSKIYPGIPEYFDSKGRGMYHYLTGSASWLVLTVLTQAFGVRGQGGDLVLAPKLVAEEFDSNQQASIECHFAGKRLHVTYVNEASDDYEIKEVFLNDEKLDLETSERVVIKIPRAIIENSSDNPQIRVILN